MLHVLTCGISARILRTLAANHVFEEVAPDVFVNNRVSSAMDAGKSVKALLDKCVANSNRRPTLNSYAEGLLKPRDEAHRYIGYCSRCGTMVNTVCGMGELRIEAYPPY